MRGRVTRSEWRWVLIWIGVAVLVTSVPYLVGWLRSTPDRTFGGFAFAIEDGYSYLSKMKQGAEGLWLFHLPYTSEAHTPTIFYFFYLLLGKLSAVTGLSTPLVYHLARVVCDAVLLAVIYRFLTLFTAWRSVRRLAFLLIIFSGGLGWLLLLTRQGAWLDSAPIDMISPEAFTFLVLYGFPHLALARACLLLGFVFLWQTNAQVKQAVLAGVSWLIMILLVPFFAAVVGAVALIGLIAEAIALRHIAWRQVGLTALAGLIAAPPLIYTFAVVFTDPIWKVWADQLVILSPHPLHYVLGYALIGVLAVIGLVKTWKRRVIDPKLIGWLVAVPLLIYLPFNSQRRLIEGWQIPLAFCAAVGLAYAVLPAWRKSRLVKRLTRSQRYTRHGLQTWLIAGLLILSSLTYTLMLVEQTTRMLAQIDLGFRPGAELAAMRWLDARTTYDDVVLSSYDTGNFLPAVVGARVFLGHGPETAYSDEKRGLVKQFFAADTLAEWRRSFLHDWPITYVFFGPLEQVGGLHDLSDLPELQSVYDQDGYRIYQVIH